MTDPATSVVTASVDKTQPTSILDAASRMLQHFDEPIPPTKLQQLLYLAQGWSLAITGRPLFDAEFEAWPCGPINREIFELLDGEHNVDTVSFASKRQRLAASQSPTAPDA